MVSERELRADVWQLIRYAESQISVRMRAYQGLGDIPVEAKEAWWGRQLIRWKQIAEKSHDERALRSVRDQILTYKKEAS